MRPIKSSDPQQIRAGHITHYKQSKAAHKPKNRSSKSVMNLYGKRPRDIYRCVSNAKLNVWSKAGMFEADIELARRERRAASKADPKG